MSFDSLLSFSFFMSFLLYEFVNGFSRYLVDFANPKDIYLSALQQLVCRRPSDVQIFHELLQVQNVIVLPEQHRQAPPCAF